jgi:Transposase IS4
MDSEGYGKLVDMSEYMVQYRFNEIRKFIPYLFADNTREANDPWWQFSKGIDEYNKNRRTVVCSSFLKVFDESMSAYRPQTTKTGNLPHLSQVERKPEDLGTEVKVTADTATGMCLYLEIQTGKQRMSEMEFTNELKATSACCCRMGKGTKRNEEEGVFETYLGDSWFASVDTCVALWNKYRLYRCSENMS